MQHETSTPKFSRGQNTTFCGNRPQFDIDQAAIDASILHADLPATQIAELLTAEALCDEVFIRTVVYEKLLRALRSTRRRQNRMQNNQYRLPGFDLLPLRIQGARDKTTDLLTATYDDIREYCWKIGSKYNERKRKDPKFQQAKALLEKMRIASQLQRGITVGEVFGLTPPRK